MCIAESCSDASGTVSLYSVVVRRNLHKNIYGETGADKQNTDLPYNAILLIVTIMQLLVIMFFAYSLYNDNKWKMIDFQM